MNFCYTDQSKKALILHLSKKRLRRYVESFGENEEQCLKLYVYDMAISEALYTSLQGIEICVRNAVDIQLAKQHGPGWHTAPSSVFRHPLTEMLDKADSTLRREETPVSRGAVVAELNFGFWVGTLAPRYEQPLWRQTLRHAFPHRPRGCERKDVHGALNAIRRLRNRVMHHEPVLHRDLRSDHDTILRVISWVCPDTAAWVREQSRFPHVFRPEITSRP